MAYLTRDPIDVGALVAAVSSPALGGTAIFVGSVRRGGEDGAVAAIEYSAYEEMGETEFGRIVREAEAKWPHAHIAVRHRLGRIPAGEASVAVVAATLHRADAFEACRYVIERVKERLPVWKKELFEDGSAAWRGNDGSRAVAPPSDRG